MALKENMSCVLDQHTGTFRYSMRQKKFSNEDFLLLESKLDSNLEPDEQLMFRDVVRIYRRNCMVNSYSRRKIYELCVPVVKIMLQGNLKNDYFSNRFKIQDHLRVMLDV